jgi:3-hydroxyacyl-CoA dehydrogenase
MKWGYGWALGPFETWDALGFGETTARMKRDGVALPAWIDKMVAAGATGFYSADGKRVWDPMRGDYAKREIDPREATFEVMRGASGPVLKNAGGRRGISATACSA